jgi:hypothetical protein
MWGYRKFTRSPGTQPDEARVPQWSLNGSRIVLRTIGGGVSRRLSGGIAGLCLLSSFDGGWTRLFLIVYAFGAWILLMAINDVFQRKKLERILRRGFALSAEEYKLLFLKRLCAQCCSRATHVKTSQSVLSYGGPDFFSRPSCLLSHRITGARCGQIWNESETAGGGESPEDCEYELECR